MEPYDGQCQGGILSETYRSMSTLNPINHSLPRRLCIQIYPTPALLSHQINLVVEMQVGSINDWPIATPHTLGSFVRGEPIQVEFPTIGKGSIVSKGDPGLFGVGSLEDDESIVVVPFAILGPAFYRESK